MVYYKSISFLFFIIIYNFLCLLQIMKIIFETLDELFSDFAEDYIFGMGTCAPLPPQYTYVPKTKEVVDCVGVTIDTCESIKEFNEKYKTFRTIVWHDNCK